MKKIIAATFATTLLLPLSVQDVQAESITHDELRHLTKTEQVKNTNAFRQILKSLPKDNAIRTQYSKYIVTAKEKDDLGFTHYTLQPKVKGHLVADKEVKIHVSPENEVVLINGETDTLIHTPTNQIVLSESEALDIVYDAIGYQPEDLSNLGDEIVKSNELLVDNDKKLNIYRIEITYVSPKAERWLFDIDAETGEILDKKDLMQQVTGSGYTSDGKYKAINITQMLNGYMLRDTTHRGIIETMSANNTESSASTVTDVDRYFFSSNQRNAVDLHVHTDTIADYYKNKFNRDSFDGLGGKIYNIADYGINYNNASFNGTAIIVGDGDGKMFKDISKSLDVVAHEYAHGLTDSEYAPVYENQSGAISESMSDIFAYFIDPDYLIGEDSYTPAITGDALRSISKPSLYGQPEHMNAYYTTTQDYGGVHHNSGIPNKAFYNTLQRIGKDKTEQIYYRAVTQYLTSTSGFKDTKQALIQSANDLYGATYGTQFENAINTSWNEVGVY